MHLSFQQSPSDLTDLTFHSLKQNPWIKVFVTIFILGIGFNLYNLVNKEDFQAAQVLSWLIPVVLIIIIWAFIIKIVNKRRFENPANKDVLIGQRDIELLEDEIRVKTPIADTTYQWSAITKLGQSKKNYFMFLGNTRAIIISKTAFQNDMEQQAFERLVSKKIDL